MGREALMLPVRLVQTATHLKRVRGPSPTNKDLIVNDLLSPCSPGDPAAIEMSWVNVPGDKLCEPLIGMEDMKVALSHQKPTVNEKDLSKLQKFTDDFGQEGS